MTSAKCRGGHVDVSLQGRRVRLCDSASSSSPPHPCRCCGIGPYLVEEKCNRPSRGAYSALCVGYFFLVSCVKIPSPASKSRRTDSPGVLPPHEIACITSSCRAQRSMISSTVFSPSQRRQTLERPVIVWKFLCSFLCSHHITLPPRSSARSSRLRRHVSSAGTQSSAALSYHESCNCTTVLYCRSYRWLVFGVTGH